MPLEKVTPNKEKARSLYRMASSSFSMAQTIDEEKYPSNTLKEYYDIIRQFIDLILLCKGYKSRGEGAHEEVITFAYQSGVLTVQEHLLANELRKMRNRISYEGFFVDYDYFLRKKKDVASLIEKLMKLSEKEIS